MDRKQVIKALECCTSADKNADCPLGCPWGDINSCEQNLMYHALSLIKQLTEENDSLQADNEHLTRVVDGKLNRISALERLVLKLTEDNERLRAENAEQDEAIIRALNEMGKIRRETKSATVKEVQERLNEAFKHYPQRCGECCKEKVDQIAKELLEETDEV